MVLHFTEALIFSSLVLLSFIVISNPLKVNRKANFWFGISLFLWATFWLDEMLYITGANPLHGTAKLGLSIVQFFSPLIFYISFIFFTNPNFKFKKKTVLSFAILPILYAVFLIVNFYTERNFKIILIGLVISHALFYSVKSYIKVKQHQKQIKLFSSSITEIDLKWLEYIILIMIFISLVIAFFNIVYFGTPLNLYINLTMLATIFFIAYNSLKQKEIFPVNKKHRKEVITINTQEESEKPSAKRKILTDEELVDYKTKLNELVKQKQLFLDQDINLASLAEQMELTTHQLSYIINNGFNQNFFQFINHYRIEKAKVLLLDKSSDKLSILGIAFESGFSSKTAFNTTFKKFTNQTPSEFKKQGSSL